METLVTVSALEKERKKKKRSGIRHVLVGPGWGPLCEMTILGCSFYSSPLFLSDFRTWHFGVCASASPRAGEVSGRERADAHSHWLD